MDYIQLTCKIISDNITVTREILSQDLADKGFESFEDTEDGLNAYIPQKDYSEMLYASLPLTILNIGMIEYNVSTIKEQNWNETWEKNFQPVIIAEKCYIRASFHTKRAEIPYEIVIEPKMSFGTGHHETTSLMIEQMMTIDFTEKEVLDMGCGTGVLSIMASKLKAKHITAIDIDEWAYKNTLENCSENSIFNVNAEMGGIEMIGKRKFDIILANINRNILLSQIPVYAKAMVNHGYLLISGIYLSDMLVVRKMAEDNGLIFQKFAEKNNWIAITFIRN